MLICRVTYWAPVELLYWIFIPPVNGLCLNSCSNKDLKEDWLTDGVSGGEFCRHPCSRKMNNCCKPRNHWQRKQGKWNCWGKNKADLMKSSWSNCESRMRAGKTGSKFNLSSSSSSSPSPSSSAWQSHLQECPWIHDLKGWCWSFPALSNFPNMSYHNCWFWGGCEVQCVCVCVCVCVCTLGFNYRAGWMWQVGECKDFHNWHPWEGLTSTQKTHTRLFCLITKHVCFLIILQES